MKLIKKLLKNFGKFPFFTVKVEGESGWPILIPGKFYLASNLFQPKSGDFIVFKNPKNIEQIFVKRVSRIIDNGYWVESLVSWGFSSNDFGLITSDLFLGKILNLLFYRNFLYRKSR